MLKLRAILSAFFFGGCGVGDPPLEEIYVPANAPLTIDITGDDYDWHIRYPGRECKITSSEWAPGILEISQ